MKNFLPPLIGGPPLGFTWGSLKRVKNTILPFLTQNQGFFVKNVSDNPHNRSRTSGRMDPNVI